MVGLNFTRSVTFTLQYEGGFVNDPHDPGGATNMGVTLATYRSAINPRASVAELRAMSASQASAIYKEHYWSQINADGLAGGVDFIAFDIAVNAGVGRAREFLKPTANLLPAARVQRLHNLRLGFWKRLATWARFGKGWTARETACLKLARSLL